MLSKSHFYEFYLFDFPTLSLMLLELLGRFVHLLISRHIHLDDIHD